MFLQINFNHRYNLFIELENISKLLRKVVMVFEKYLNILARTFPKFTHPKRYEHFPFWIYQNNLNKNHPHAQFFHFPMKIQILLLQNDKVSRKLT